ncbi:pyruvate dehydrogenase subunit beta [Novosphingobium marinum]|uniref:Pyruvate dehydrogenase E1 component beta subunit n=1 Tax=Novosphingobium marinum TaxID=1514948 RepID=A0A7Z0BVY3_9SPHN|nr:transketolase C-terminal domain-containing protein [Novosphingobium marinum]NYH96768.1 pyruvate dehydrogenase E1 component beta subunit [Novosphingobium marinum]GGC40401.1 pyruvate dehydrogenase subunit beta [Novosphingobium marinum]
MARATFLDAIRQAQQEEMERDERVFLMGEDVRCNVFGTTTNFVDMFGDERVRDTPISENGFVGAAGGAAMVGMRPIADVTISSFLYPAMDQICSIIAKSRYIYGGQAKLPLVIRSCLFYGNSNAAQHSDRPYSMFMNMPGLKIIAPSNAYDMKGLLKAAIRDDDPVLSFEDSTCWMAKSDIPEGEDLVIPLGKGDIKREGRDVTIIAIAGAVNTALKAAKELESEGISAEIVDPRTLVPLDKELILQSVRKTGRAICVDVAHQTCSAASEISAIIVENEFESLKGPVLRVTTPDTHLPFSPHIEKPLYPTVERIVAAAKKVVGQRQPA